MQEVRPLVEPLSHDFHCFVSIWVHEDQLARLDLIHQHRGRLDDGLDAALLVRRLLQHPAQRCRNPLAVLVELQDVLPRHLSLF